MALAALLTVSIAPKAEAILLSFENAPIAGQPFTQGQFNLKYSNLDMGTVYTGLAPGNYGNAANVALGVGVLDGIAGKIQALGALTGSPLGDGLDDSWGIGATIGIFNPPTSSTNPVWTSGGKGYELNAVFFGAQDFATNIAANGLTQTTESVGLHLNIYANPIGTFDAVKALGSGGRGLTQNQFSLISAGVLELAFLSTPGGLVSNALTEFQTVFTPGFGGTGSSFMNVVGGASAAQFDTNSVNLFYGGTADVSINFTTRGPLDATNTIPAGSDWLVSSEDPVLGRVVPEPGTFLAGLGCFLSVVARRRRN